MSTIKFECSTHGFVRNKFNSFSDRHRLSEEEINEVLTYKNISEEFEYQDWFGSSTLITATIEKVEKGEYDSLIFYIQTSESIPEHYIPTPFEILKGKGLLFPTSVRRITNILI